MVVMDLVNIIVIVASTINLHTKEFVNKNAHKDTSSKIENASNVSRLQLKHATIKELL